MDEVKLAAQPEPGYTFKSCAVSVHQLEQDVGLRPSCVCLLEALSDDIYMNKKPFDGRSFISYIFSFRVDIPLSYARSWERGG